MDPFWNNLYDEDKDRRYGKLFFTAFLVLIGIIVILGCLTENLGADAFHDICLEVGPVLGLVIAIFGWRWIRAAHRNRQGHLKYSSLSRDELAKARSKLKTRMKIEPPKRQTRAARQAAARRPDTDLKY
jgi:hypothetical protein